MTLREVSLGARRWTSARAWALSSAGRMPSVRDSRWKASIASSSVAACTRPGPRRRAAMLRPHRRVVEPGGDRMGGAICPSRSWSTRVRVPWSTPREPPSKRAACSPRPRPGPRPRRRSTAPGVVQEGGEDPERVRAAADAGDDQVGCVLALGLLIWRLASSPITRWKSRTIRGRGRGRAPSRGRSGWSRRSSPSPGAPR